MIIQDKIKEYREKASNTKDAFEKGYNLGKAHMLEELRDKEQGMVLNNFYNKLSNDKELSPEIQSEIDSMVSKKFWELLESEVKK